MSERIKPSEKPKKEPFEIRGHHLVIHADMIKRGETPRKYAYKSMQTFKYNQEKAKRNMQYENNKASSKSEKNPKIEYEYYRDILGTSLQDAVLYEKKYFQTLSEFAKLPDSKLIALTSGKPDGICGACTRGGEHCTMRNPDKFGGGIDFKEYDDIFVNEFLLAAEDAYLLDPIKWSSKKVKFSDDSPATVNIVTMPAGNVKKTLQFIVDTPKNYPEFTSVLGYK